MDCNAYDSMAMGNAEDEALSGVITKITSRVIFNLTARPTAC